MTKRPLAAPSFFENSPLVDRFLAKLQHQDDISSFNSTLSLIDQQIYDQYANLNYQGNPVSKELYCQPASNSMKLTVPKCNSLTDNLLRSTLGCEEKLAKSYIQILDNPGKREEEDRKKKSQLAKKKFAESNSHKDFAANSKPFMTNVRFALQRPVIDNEHDSYLKTQLIFLEQPRGTNPNTKDYFDKHTDLIAKKINQLGGMEDTIGRMEESLSRNEVKGFRKKQVLMGMRADKKAMFSPQKPPLKESGLRESWVNRSKEMRESFIAKLQIQ